VIRLINTLIASSSLYAIPRASLANAADITPLSAKINGYLSRALSDVHGGNHIFPPHILYDSNAEIISAAAKLNQ
jgi:hypothetical protein